MNSWPLLSKNSIERAKVNKGSFVLSYRRNVWIEKVILSKINESNEGMLESRCLNIRKVRLFGKVKKSSKLKILATRVHLNIFMNFWKSDLSIRMILIPFKKFFGEKVALTIFFDFSTFLGSRLIDLTTKFLKISFSKFLIFGSTR